MFPQTIPMFAKCFYINKIDIDSHKILKGITEKFIPSSDGTNTDLSQTSIDKLITFLYSSRLTILPSINLCSA